MTETTSDESALRDATCYPSVSEMESHPEYARCIDSFCRMAHLFEPSAAIKSIAVAHVRKILSENGLEDAHSIELNETITKP